MSTRKGADPTRFLLALIDGGGTVPPALGLATELVRRGHRVRVLADPTVEESARSTGSSFSAWREAPHFDSRAEQTAVIAAAEGSNPARAVLALRRFTGRQMTIRYARDVIATAREFGAEAVVGDLLPGILLGGQASGRPTAALLANVYLRPTPGLPLLGTGWSPGNDLWRRTRDRTLPAVAPWLLNRMVPRLNRAAAELGQPPLKDLFEVFDRCRRVLVMTSPSFDFGGPPLPANVRYVGPQLDDPDWAASEDWPRPASRPLVLVATSSIYQDQTDLLRRVTAALGRLPVSGIVTTGRAVDPAAVPAPANVTVVRAAPHRLILREASLLVTHAGHGTVMKGLAAGVPLLCIPMGRDQRDNTARVVRLGAGVRLDRRAPPQRIATAAAAMLGDPRYAEAARRFADVLATEAATRPTAADEAEALVPA